MNPIRAGLWSIYSVEVNGQPTSGDDGFVLLVCSADEIRLEPAGIIFAIQQATPRSAVLESRSQIFYADFNVRGEKLTLNLSRPAFDEKVSLKAAFDPAMAHSLQE